MQTTTETNPITGQPFRERLHGPWVLPSTLQAIYNWRLSSGRSVGVVLDRMSAFCAANGFNPSANPVLPVKAKETPKKGRV